ncbi:MAG TPA: hypothetical protein VKV17_20400 [Bryobacteraceae bacterium]|nr:hypothetical protein [Bryobacteraceae bacterium]
MKSRFRSLWAAAALAGLAVPLGLRAASDYKPPRTADGQPDLQGIWEVKASPDKDLEKSKVIVEPKNGKIPYLPAALEKKKENEKNSAKADPLGKCYMPGVPRINLLNYPLQIFQTPTEVAIAYEYIHNWRNIYLKRDKHLDGIDFWQGDSIGHWEGDTLVVDVGDFNDQTWFDKAGDYHSDSLHVTERYTRTGPDTLLYEATIEDPKTFSQPWKIRAELRRNTQPNARILEYECEYLKEVAAQKAAGKSEGK